MVACFSKDPIHFLAKCCIMQRNKAESEKLEQIEKFVYLWAVLANMDHVKETL